MRNTLSHLKAYYFPLLLITSIIAGGVAGCVLGHQADALKPISDIFLNLILTAIVPLIFFSISASVTRMGDSRQVGKILGRMFGTFVFTGIIAAIFMIYVVKLFPPALGVNLQLTAPNKIETINLADQIVSAVSVTDFSQLLSHANMLPLIFFSLLVGLATVMTKTKTESFARFLQSGADMSLQLVTIIMYLAPLGFFACFAVLIGDAGTQLMQDYLRVFLIYYPAALVYFIVAFTFYAWLAGGRNSISLFWKNILVPSLTSLSTCSSAASIPANLQASKDMGVSAKTYETVIPLGAMLHKDGSVLGAIIKIAFLFGIFHMSFSGTVVLLTALVTAILAGTVMGAIPGGGMLGEMLILSLYGFPPQALIVIAAISIIIDPLATMLNVTGDTVCGMMVERLSNKT